MIHGIVVVATMICCCCVCSVLQVTINNMDDFWSLRETLADGLEDQMNVDLMCDLDLDNKTHPFDRPLGVPQGALVPESEACRPFKGVFNGNGHKVSNMAIKVECDHSFTVAGFMCRIESGKVSDLVFDASCSLAGDIVGTLAAESTNGSIVNNVTSEASVLGGRYAGGLIGKARNVTISHCTNKGPIVLSAKYGSVGGLVGLSIGRALFSSCINNNMVSANSLASLFSNRKMVLAGGLLGSSLAEVIIRGCCNKGAVNASSVVLAYAGGFVGGCNMDSTIEGAENTGNIVSIAPYKAYAGGLFGQCDFNHSIVHFVNHGEIIATGPTIDATTVAGGVVGQVALKGGNWACISHCKNSGSVTANSSASGLVGQVLPPAQSEQSAIINISSCANEGNITSAKDAAGIILNSAYTALVSVLNCLNRGTINAISSETQFAIGTNISNVFNCVSMGQFASGEPTSWLLVDENCTITNNSVYSLDVPLSNAVMFTKSNASAQFVANANGSEEQQVDMLLNTKAEAIEDHNREAMKWTSALELKDVVHSVRIGNPQSITLFVGHSEPLSSVPLPPAIANLSHKLPSEDFAEPFPLDRLITRNMKMCIECDMVIFDESE